MQKTHTLMLLLAMIIISSLSGCATPKGATVTEKRADVNAMRQDALQLFYERMPDMRYELEKAPGFAVFSGYSTQTIFLATGNGFGVIRDNQTGQDTYMQGMKLGGGLGVGLESVYGVIIFDDAAKMQSMIRNGWGVSGRVEAAAKSSESGGSRAAVITLPGMHVYRFTKRGVMLGAAIEGAKLWPDSELN